MDNLAMMAGSIGQPKVRGKRLERGYQDRVLSHFPRKVKGSKEKGFVSSSSSEALNQPNSSCFQFLVGNH